MGNLLEIGHAVSNERSPAVRLLPFHLVEFHRFHSSKEMPHFRLGGGDRNRSTMIQSSGQPAPWKSVASLLFTLKSLVDDHFPHFVLRAILPFDSFQQGENGHRMTMA